MLKILLSILFLSITVSLAAQKKGMNDSSYLIQLTQQIDDAVVRQDTQYLKKQYASDFVFSHGSGRVEGRDGWLRSVAKGGFTLRKHDSVTVELHQNIAIVKGLLHVVKKGKEKTDSYHLKYIKVYTLNGRKWKIISHSTVSEYHDLH